MPPKPKAVPRPRRNGRRTIIANGIEYLINSGPGPLIAIADHRLPDPRTYSRNSKSQPSTAKASRVRATPTPLSASSSVRTTLTPLSASSSGRATPTPLPSSHMVPAGASQHPSASSSGRATPTPLPSSHMVPAGASQHPSASSSVRDTSLPLATSSTAPVGFPSVSTVAPTYSLSSTSWSHPRPVVIQRNNAIQQTVITLDAPVQLNDQNPGQVAVRPVIPAGPTKAANSLNQLPGSIPAQLKNVNPASVTLRPIIPAPVGQTSGNTTGLRFANPTGGQQTFVLPAGLQPGQRFVIPAGFLNGQRFVLSTAGQPGLRCLAPSGIGGIQTAPFCSDAATNQAGSSPTDTNPVSQAIVTNPVSQAIVTNPDSQAIVTNPVSSAAVTKPVSSAAVTESMPPATVTRVADPDIFDQLDGPDPEAVSNEPDLEVASGSVAEPTSDKTGKGIGKKRTTWLQADAFRMLKLYKTFRNNPKYLRAGGRYSIWNDIATELGRGGGGTYSGPNCKDKYDNLYSKLKERCLKIRKKEAVKPWAFHDSMMILNKDKPEMKLTNVAEVGGVSKSRTENDEESDEMDSDGGEVTDRYQAGPSRPKKRRMTLAVCLESMMQNDSEKAQEQQSYDREFMEAIKSIKNASERKAEQSEKNSEVFSRLANALISNLNSQSK